MAVPVKYNKNGSVSGYSKVVAGEDFQAMMVHARKKMKDARTKILNGDVGDFHIREDRKAAVIIVHTGRCAAST